MINRTTTASGPGAAHIGFGMFGARGPLLEHEGAGGGSGTSGAGAPPTQQPGTPPAEQPKLFTQDEVNKLVGQARVEGRDAATKKPTTGTPAPASEGGDERLSLKQLQQRLDDSELRRTFDRRALKLGIDDDAADDLFELFRVQRPSDATSWLDEKVKRFGLKTSGNTTTQTTNPQQPPNGSSPTTPAQPRTPPISDKGAPLPGEVRDHERQLADNPIGFGGVDYERLVAKHGKAKADAMWMETAQQKAGTIKVTFR